ncbi:MAG: putative bifunctional diguanylate cyclase/phosphodiesterase [Thiobacillus sp.]
MAAINLMPKWNDIKVCDRILLLGACLLGLLWPAAAGAAPDARTVRVGVYDNPPIVSAPAHAAPAGIAIDILKWVAEREGWRLVYVADGFDQLLARLDRGEIDLIAAMGYSDERAHRVQFSQQSLLGNWGMLYRHAGARIETVPDLKGKRVALMRGGTHTQALIELAERFDAAFTPVYVDNFPQVLEAIIERRADAGAVNRVFAALHAHHPDLVATPIVYNPVYVHYAAPRNADPAVLAALDRHLAQLKADPRSAYYESLRRWLEAAPDGRTPRWLRWMLAGIAFVLTLAVIFALFLRRQVRRQTSELQRHAEMLHAEIREREAAQQHLKKIAYTDSLTGLPNREGFNAALGRVLDDLKGTQERLALLFIDVDRLKNVNDSLGHGAGDQLLKEVAGRLQSVLRAHDHLSRFGGDEFVVIVGDIERNTDAELVAARLLHSLAEPFHVGPTQIYSTASIGIALYPDDADASDTLLKHADTAMYQAKAQGGNRYLFYRAEQTARVVERLTLDTRLRQALDRGEFVLHYQPIVDLRRRVLVGVEALVRWNDPERGLVMPNAFIPVAEDTGLIVPLGEWVLQTGCAQLKAWQDEGRANGMRLAVNVSTRQFDGQRLVRSVEQALGRTGLAAGCLELEITENVMLVMNEDVRASLDVLRKIGVQLSLDDFGTGYSSLSYLRQLPFHALKIDRSFVSRIPGEANDIQMVTTILALAKGLGMETIAEGIETRAQFDFLSQQGCEFGQGYWISRPLTAEALARLLDQPLLLGEKA